MEWYVFALLAPAFWALDSIFVKFLIAKKFKSYYPAIAIITIADVIFAFAISLFTPIAAIVPFSVFALLVGLLPLVGFWFFSQAMLIEDVSRVVTLFQLIPLFVIFLSVVFLNEVLGVQSYVGIGLVVFAATLISYKSSVGKAFSLAVKFMIPFGLIYAVYTIVDKALLIYLDFWSLFFWNIVGTFCGVVVLLFRSSFRRKLVDVVTSVGGKVFLVTFVGEGTYVIGTLCSLVALSLVEAPLASAFSALQPFYVFFYVLFLSLFLPKVLKEDISKKSISLKIVAITLMFVGTWLII